MDDHHQVQQAKDQAHHDDNVERHCIIRCRSTGAIISQQCTANVKWCRTVIIICAL